MIDYLRARNSETPLGPQVTSPEFENETQRRNFVRMGTFALTQYIVE